MTSQMQTSNRQYCCDTESVCPHCGRAGAVLQARTHQRVLFLIIGAQFTTTHSIMCTRCIRKDVLKSIPGDMLCSHLIWPLIFTIMEEPQFIFSFLKERAYMTGLMHDRESIWKKRILWMLGGLVSVVSSWAIFISIGWLVFHK